MNAVQRVLSQRYLYGGEVWQLGAIYKDLETIAAHRLPDDCEGQRRMVESYISGMISTQGEGIPADAAIVIIDGRTFLA